MSSQDKYIIEKFEKIAWLYISGELPEEELSFWEKEIDKNNHLKRYLDEITEAENIYKEMEFEDISEAKYLQAFENATNKSKSFSLKLFISRIIYGTSEEINPGYKIAFTSVIIVAALVIFLLSKNPNPVKDISSELLSWENESVSSEINEIEDGLYLMKNKEVDENIKMRITSDPWDNEIYTIKNQIKLLENELSGNEL